MVIYENGEGGDFNAITFGRVADPGEYWPDPDLTLEQNLGFHTVNWFDPLPWSDKNKWIRIVKNWKMKEFKFHLC